MSIDATVRCGVELDARSPPPLAVLNGPDAMLDLGTAVQDVEPDERVVWSGAEAVSEGGSPLGRARADERFPHPQGMRWAASGG